MSRDPKSPPEAAEVAAEAARHLWWLRDAGIAEVPLPAPVVAPAAPQVAPAAPAARPPAPARSAPAPGAPTAFATTRSQRFRRSFSRAFETTSSVSAANPTSTGDRSRPASLSPTVARMSVVRSSRSVSGPSAFFFFDGDGSLGR